MTQHNPTEYLRVATAIQQSFISDKDLESGIGCLNNVIAFLRGHEGYGLAISPLRNELETLERVRDRCQIR
jgi:hypothetical protein